MQRSNYLFTSELVSEGHPDKVCDQISDAILDAFLENDLKLGIADDSKVNTRLGCETLCTTNKIVIAGEGRGQAPLFRKHGDKAVVDREMITEIARGVVKDIGYDQDGFSYYGADVEVLLHGQSPDIAMGVDAKKKKGSDEEGAGDQGMMFGYACTESEVYEKGSFMPAPIYFAHKILKVLSEKRRSGALFDLQPDAKSQVTVKYVDGQPVGCTKVVVSTQHNAQTRNGKKYSPGMVKEMIGDSVEEALPDEWMPKKPSDFLVNPTGNFVIGGPDARRRLGAISASSGLRVVALVILVAGIGCFVVLGRAVRRRVAPLGSLIEAAARIEHGDYSARVPERGGRDVRGLTRAFNSMSARLSAIDTQRRAFLADVAHELRTPLSIMRGRLEAMLGTGSTSATTSTSVRSSRMPRRSSGSSATSRRSRRPRPAGSPSISSRSTWPCSRTPSRTTSAKRARRAS